MKTYCEHCHGETVDDSRGACGSCGAPRPRKAPAGLVRLQPRACMNWNSTAPIRSAGSVNCNSTSTYLSGRKLIDVTGWGDNIRTYIPAGEDPPDE